MLHVIDSNKSIQDIEKRFPAAVEKNKFAVVGFHNLKQKMIEKGVAFEQECLVFEVCNSQQAKKILDQNMGISTALPCRVAVYQEGGKTKIATLKPTVLLSLFSTPQLFPVASEIERTLFKIMDEAA